MEANPRTREQEAMEALVRGMADALDLPVLPEWVPGIAQQLAITLSMADLLDEMKLGDEAQAAAVYRI